MDENAAYFAGWMNTAVGKVARISTYMDLRDRLGGCKVRWGIGRMRYTVAAGLYAIGEPNSASEVLVTANYKLSFDLLRRELSGRNLWLLVLETFGINVWCAAGKGTFGTRELIDRIRAVPLAKLVTHRTIILPQLGGSGVAAHEIKKATGFQVRYGPVRSRDLPDYLDNGMKATAEFRRVRFTLRDRLVLTPVELVQAWKPSVIILPVIFLSSGLSRDGFNLAATLSHGLIPSLVYLGALLTGSLITPVLLPWIPGRAFSLKGAQLGFLLALLVSLTWTPGLSGASLVTLFLMAPAVAAYFAMNYTGCSTFTSLSGVQKEMRIAVPIIILSIALGGVAWLMGKLL